MEQFNCKCGFTTQKLQEYLEHKDKCPNTWDKKRD